MYLPSKQLRSPSQPLTQSCSQTWMQPLMLNVFNLRISPQDLFALTSSPQTLVAVAELERMSGMVVIDELPTTVASASSLLKTPYPGVVSPH